MSKLSDLANEMASGAMANILKDGYLVPVMVVQDEAGKGAFVMLDMDHKDYLEVAVPEVLKRLNAQRYVMVVEAWAAQCAPGEDPYDGPMPSEHPNRKEVVMICGREKDPADKIFMMFEIKRDAEGNVSTLEPSERPDDFDGRFANFFEPNDEDELEVTIEEED